jgi:hypothetical protein
MLNNQFARDGFIWQGRRQYSARPYRGNHGGRNVKTIIFSIAVALGLIAVAALADIGPEGAEPVTKSLVGPCTGCQPAWGSHD